MEGTKCWGTGMVMATITIIICCTGETAEGDALAMTTSWLQGEASLPLPLLCLFLFPLFLIPLVALKLLYMPSPLDPTNKALFIKPVSVYFMQHFLEHLYYSVKADSW